MKWQQKVDMAAKNPDNHKENIKYQTVAWEPLMLY